MIVSGVYLLCALTSLLCMILLIRSFRKTRVRLLFWTSAFFTMIAVANALLFIDLVIVPNMDMTLTRTSITFAAVCLLLYGLIWEEGI
jgi:hypothetical protein